MTDNRTSEPTGWVFYDAECRFCVRGVEQWGRLFARRGFVWMPLQTPGTAQRLGVTESELRSEMKLLTADAHICGGVDAWARLFRSVWWLWPVGVLLALPGLRSIGAFAYRRVARNRHCPGGNCRLHARASHRHRTFLEMP
jgi:predicted DCC family thiol-disulfide oxidoreductase YuxK